MTQIISLIAAVGNNGVIGSNGKIPWYLPADFRYFKQVTDSRPLIMGRKTHESIGHILPGRKNIVISSQKEYEPIAGGLLASSLEKGLTLADEGEVFIIGGARLYEEALPSAQKLYLTEVEGDFEGDTFFPEIREEEWKELFRETRKSDERNQYSLVWRTLERIKE